MKIVCTHNMPFAKEAFSTLGETTSLEGRSITAADVRDVDLLATRSTTKVNAALLDGSRVRFAGTATIGTDHLDIDYLESHGIHWCFSPGCNANSVSEYITTALLCLANRHNFTLKGKTIGVIGVGNVGSKVVIKAEALGMKVLQNDPPRERAGVGGSSAALRAMEDRQRSEVGDQQKCSGEVAPHPRATGENDQCPSALPPSSHLAPLQPCDLDTLLAESDIVTTHVPMTKEGVDKTYHMADESFFAKMKPGSIFINAARGAVVKSEALMDAIKSGHISHVVLDTWEGEPNVSPELLQAVDIGTPHIAGHSFEGKVAGTVMVYQDACRFLNVEPTWTPDALLPPAEVPEVILDVGDHTDEQLLWAIVKQIYDIESDDARLRAPSENKSALFDTLRKNYPVRREFRFTTVDITGASEQLKNTLNQLGFKSKDS